MQGAIHISPPVLATIVELTALGTPGVAKMHRHRRLASLRGGGHAEGVQLTVADDTVQASVSIVVEPGSNALEVGRAVQRNIARALHDMAGMTVGEINVQIQDVGETL
jgi:uncharacterized alkaline shock family protein YloU